MNGLRLIKPTVEFQAAYLSVYEEWKRNIGSEKTILNNGGVFASEFMEDDGNVVRRFWIPLEQGSDSKGGSM